LDLGGVYAGPRRNLNASHAQRLHDERRTNPPMPHDRRDRQARRLGSSTATTAGAVARVTIGHAAAAACRIARVIVGRTAAAAAGTWAIIRVTVRGAA
jgi:hypothetical protein